MYGYMSNGEMKTTMKNVKHAIGNWFKRMWSIVINPLCFINQIYRGIFRHVNSLFISKQEPFWSMPVKDGWWSTNSPSDLPKYIISEMICLPINQPRFWTLYL